MFVHNLFCQHCVDVLCAGEDCSQVADFGYWEVVQPKDFQPEGSASHTAMVWRDSLYIVGGESYNRSQMMYIYDFNGELFLLYTDPITY